MSSFNVQLNKVNKLKNESNILKRLLTEKKYELENETKILQDICEHEYIKESDGDYHKPGYYYVCKNCDYFTRFTPKEFNLHSS